jgi:ergothioneine biosynthesis protein EgtB
MPLDPHPSSHLLERFRAARAQTEALVRPLSPEDMLVQSMPDASPSKWHLAHTTWFFEEFVLARFDQSYRVRDPSFRVLFNSYYEAVGARHPRHARGLLSRPSLEEVFAWRRAVDDAMTERLAHLGAAAADVTELGIQHEQQHQELVMSDVLHALSCNPFEPAYAASADTRPTQSGAAGPSSEWVSFDDRLGWFGHRGEGFSFDNEGPSHRAFVGAFSIAARPVTNAEYQQFVEDGGYDRVGLWLSDGWAAARAGHWRAPLYWRRDDSGWSSFTLRGRQPLEGAAPVAHLSFFEADAYARWAGARLPTEYEWELAASDAPVAGNFLESGRLTPESDRGAATTAPRQLFGDVWEWTSSAYLPYPRFRPVDGALGEYNGKFMSGQMVLRGGSCWSPRSHLRPTYRNFFPPTARWQMAGFRLARDRG